MNWLCRCALISLATGLYSMSPLVRADIPPAAQEAVNKGLLAAKEQEWEIAIASFEEARKVAPDAPELFGYLGTAESKIPGRELRAIAWLGAYLAANPRAANASAVKEAIAGLQIKVEGNITRMVKLVEDADALIPDTPVRAVEGLGGQHYTTSSDDDREKGLYWAAELWGRAGKPDEALRVVNRVGHGHKDNQLLQLLVRAQLVGGFLGDAKQTAALIDDGFYWFESAQEIAIAEAKSGDISAGRSTLSAVVRRVEQEKAEGRQIWYGDIVETQITMGDLSAAAETARLVQDIDYGYVAQRKVAEAKLKSGDIDGTKQALAFARTHLDQDRAKAFSGKEDPYWRDNRLEHIPDRYLEISRLYWEVGLCADARRSLEIAKDAADRLKEADIVGGVQLRVAYAALRFGDLRSTLVAISRIVDPEMKDIAANELVTRQLAAGDISGARKSAGMISPKSLYGWSVANDIERAVRSPPAQFVPIDPKSCPVPVAAASDNSAMASGASLPPVGTAVNFWTKKIEDLNQPLFRDPSAYLKTRLLGDPGQALANMAASVEQFIDADRSLRAMVLQVEATQ